MATQVKSWAGKKTESDRGGLHMRNRPKSPETIEKHRTTLRLKKESCFTEQTTGT
jgi:hypothetical protein